MDRVAFRFVVLCLTQFAIAGAMRGNPAAGPLPHHRQLGVNNRHLARLTPASRSDDDVDGDGVADAQDVCCQTPPGVPVDTRGRPLGDLDLDCDVDLADVAVFQEAFTGPLGPCDAEICNNGVDDDDDSFVDCDDWDCADHPACIDEICDNGIDDDGDGYVDCDDWDCNGDSACPGEICDNGIDDDGDGYLDCCDSECDGDSACTVESVCDNAFDDDCDGFIDCNDFDCAWDPACP